MKLRCECAFLKVQHTCDKFTTDEWVTITSGEWDANTTGEWDANTTGE
ncbi:MAG: hypothetical protein J1D88_00610 [Treponema sp.]|nr:hypothetical protein [Treponema sp.]